MRAISVFVLGIALMLLLGAIGLVSLANAQEAGSIVAPTSIWYEIWTVVQPVVAILVMTVGPALVGWIATRLASFLNAADEAKRKELEQQLSSALHQSALNALKFALAKLGVGIPADLQIAAPVIKEAIDYVRSKNPDAIDAFDLDDTALGEIILSKVPDVKAIVTAGASTPKK